MNKVILFLILFSIYPNIINSKNSDKLYEKIDLFGEVLEKIKKYGQKNSH